MNPALATLKEIADAAAKDPESCGEHCKCLCHTDTQEPHDHLLTCAWADPDFPDYLTADAP